MKILIVLMTAFLMQVSASTFAQKITLDEKKASLFSIFEKINKQSGFNFLVNVELLDQAKPVDIRVREAELSDVLDQLFKSQPLIYKIEGKSVIIKAKEASFLDKLSTVISNIVRDLTIKGRVVNENGKALPNASIQVKGKPAVFTSNENGEFNIPNVPEDGILVIRYVGYKALEIPVKGASMPLEIKLNLATGELEEVKVVYNTGYQNIDKTRATGSFVQVNNELINRKVGTDILSRLEGVVPGLLFDRRPDVSTGGATGIQRQNLQIRGLYTLTEEISQPLIVLDNFPFTGNLLDINPNDVENITILKDAAAASIWGAKAGNGVIVITTKRGSFNQKFRVSFDANFTSIPKQDLFSVKDMSVNDYIDIEKFLFEKGAYNGVISDPIFGVLTPVQEILLRVQEGKIDRVQADLQIDALRQYDVRKDFMKYLYRDELRQQYSLNLNGGGNNIKYAISGGYDKNPGNLIGNQYNRLSFRSNTTIAPVKNFEIRLGIAYTQGNTVSNSPGGYDAYQVGLSKLHKYARLADENGNPLPLDLSYRSSFTDTAGKGKLLDWKFRPLEELNNRDNSALSRQMIGDLSIRYNFFKGLSAEVSSQYQRSSNEQKIISNNPVFETRDLINRFTQITGNTVKYIVPNDGILVAINQNSTVKNLRGGLNFNQSWYDKHEVSAIMGVEINEKRTDGSSYRTYGYNDRLNTSNVDFVTQYPTTTGGTGTVPNTANFTGLTDRFVSLYTNASYTYNKKYTVSGSARRDASNLFGLKTNDRWKPFWSVGVLWNIAEEPFYKIKWLPVLKARVTYGYNGNVNQSGRAQTVIFYNSPNAITGLPWARILTPGNPSLRWEKLNTFNAGIDFALQNGILSGSIEYYSKKSTDVIASEALDKTTGLISNLLTNSANITGNGVDIQLNAQIVNKSLIKYNATLGFSHVRYLVTKYLANPASKIGSVTSGFSILPFSNPYSIVSYKWAGLDPLTGDPQGILNGEVSKDYNKLTQIPVQENVNQGSALPKYFGNLLNTITVGSLSVSANITYKLGYYFRKSSINYGALGIGAGHVDYLKRWQKPGDEKLSDVPSFVYGAPASRDTFYLGSEATVERADHVRLEDIRVSYSLPKSVLQKLKLGNLQLYGYFGNLDVLLYKANNAGLDPNYPNILKPGKSISMGLKAGF